MRQLFSISLLPALIYFLLAHPEVAASKPRSAAMTEGDEEFKKEFKGNDPTVKFQRNRAFKNKR